MKKNKVSLIIFCFLINCLSINAHAGNNNSKLSETISIGINGFDITGDWINTDYNTKGITKFTIRNNTIRVFGKCHPEDCDWGSVTLVSHGNNTYTAFFRESYVKRTLEFIYIKNELVLNETDVFDPKDGRGTNVYHYKFIKKNLQAISINPQDNAVMNMPLVDIDGNWVNKDFSTSGITKFSINNHSIHVFGKCHPIDCDWGIVALKSEGNNKYTAIFDQGFKVSTLQIVLEGNELILYVTDVFNSKDNRGTKEYEYRFRKQNFEDNREVHNNGNYTVSPAVVNINGNWLCKDYNSSGLTKLQINDNTVHVFGKCHPTDCDWGSVAFKSEGNNRYTAIFDQSFKVSTLQIVVEGNELVVYNTDVFKPGDSRGTKNYTYRFIKQDPRKMIRRN